MTSKKDSAPLHGIVAGLAASYRAEPAMVKIGEANRISRAAVVASVRRLREIVYGGFFAETPLDWEFVEYYLGRLVEQVHHDLAKQVRRALRHQRDDEAPPAEADAAAQAEAITTEFLRRLPGVRAVLATDLEATYDGDPAAYNRDEIVLSYPGVFAVCVHRLAHELYDLGVPLIPRMMSEYAHGRTAIDIHPGARIGHHFFIDHGTGIVIGETTLIGDHVKIYQGVTLGGLSTRGGQALRSTKRHPTIEDDVTIYSGASILGGQTVIGAGSVIGANAFLTSSVPPGSRVSIADAPVRD
ncbi:MAG: serine acetyltransferase [Actinomycetia bacterium]|nr:serine acetyltransferase [Actinomycetes bacterium]